MIAGIRNRVLGTRQILSVCLMNLAVLLIAMLSVGQAQAVEIKEVVSPGGIKALLVEDYTVPIIAMGFSLKGGTTQDPQGKEGTLTLLTSMLDEGAGDMDNKAFQAKAEEIGAEMRFSASSDATTGSIRMLKSEADASFELFSLAINKPRLDAQPMERIRTALKEHFVRAKFSSGTLMGKKLRASIYGEQAYGRESRGTEESLSKITRDDLIAMKQKVFAREKLFIGVVGAITEEELGKKLDDLFGSWPQKSSIDEIPEAKMHFGDDEHVSLDTPQASVQIIYPGVKRDDKDFFAAHLMVHILGGGTFSSRLYSEIREKRGLVYSISSWLSSRDHSASIGISFSTKADQVKQATDLVYNEVKKMAENGPTAEELESAKKNIFGSYAINNLDNSSSIAGVLVTLQSEGLGVDYLEKRGEYINSVTLEDTKRMAKQLLSEKPTTVVVGPGSS